jgi:hypothetical protein
MILITTYYQTSNIHRNNEINKCLKYNFLNKNIKEIYLLNNEIYDLDFIEKNNKIKQIKISDNIDYKLKYNDAIDYINKNFKKNICILSNSDIYFDNTLSKINNKNINNSLFALLRYDEDKYGNKNIFTRHGLPRDDSQDCWIFKSPLNVDLEKINFSFGTLGCDNIFATIVYNSGIKICNPCLDIVSIHVHNTEFRTYNVDNRIHGKYGLLKPCCLDEYPEIVFMDY